MDDDIYKELNRLTWGSGDYQRIAEFCLPDAVRLVEDANISTGLKVLDVATGTGNVAVAAAQRGASVIGVDLTPEHFPVAQERASAAGVLVDWREGDAEHLEFDSDSFDRVFSTFGAQFAPRNDRVAGEMYRVCAPGGLIGMCNWTPSGWTGRSAEVIASNFPAPPDHVQPAMDWGHETRVRALFEPLGGTVETELRSARYRFTSVDEMILFFDTHFGPWVIGRTSITPRGRWDGVLEDLTALTRQFDSGVGETVVDADYLRVLVRKPA